MKKLALLIPAFLGAMLALTACDTPGLHATMLDCSTTKVRFRVTNSSDHDAAALPLVTVKDQHGHMQSWDEDGRPVKAHHYVIFKTYPTHDDLKGKLECEVTV